MFSFLQFYISFLYTQKKPRFTIFGLMERKKQTIVQLWGASPWCDVCVRGGSHLATLASLTLIQGARRGGNLLVPHPHASSPIIQCSRGIHMLEVRSYRARNDMQIFRRYVTRACTIQAYRTRLYPPCCHLATLASLDSIPFQKSGGNLHWGGLQNIITVITSIIKNHTYVLLIWN